MKKEWDKKLNVTLKPRLYTSHNKIIHFRIRITYIHF